MAGRGVPLVVRGVVHGDGDGTACDSPGVEVRSFEAEVHSTRSYQRMEGEDRSLVGCWAA